MESQLIRILPACLTEPLPRGWEGSTGEYILELMPEVEAPQAIVMALETTDPDVLLLDADLSGADPFEVAVEALRARPELLVVMLSRDNAPERLRRAMFSGVEEYLIRPLDGPALRAGILGLAQGRTLRVVARGEIEASLEPNAAGLVVGLLSGKGGLGKTTLAVNMASVVAKAAGHSVGVLSLDTNGDAAVLLNLQPRLGLLDLAGGASDRREEGGFAVEWLRQFQTVHKSGISYWQWSGSASITPKSIPDDFLPALFDTCRRAQTVTFVDFSLLSAEEASLIFPLMDVILTVASTSDLLALRATKTFLDLIPEELSPRVRVLINRSDPSDMISREDFEDALDHKIAAVLPNQPGVAAQAINMGSPFLLTQPGSELASTVRELTTVLFRLTLQTEAPKPRKRFMLFG